MIYYSMAPISFAQLCKTSQIIKLVLDKKFRISGNLIFCEKRIEGFICNVNSIVSICKGP
jgi:hypothetical protein